MAYSFEQLFAADPSNPSNIAQDASITIFAPGDANMAPLTITDPDGSPLPNPITVNANGFASAFAHATLDRVAWAGGGFTGFVTSYEGMKAEAEAARTAAEAAAAAAANSASLVGAPADPAIAAAINGPTTETRGALDAGYAPKNHAHGAATSSAAGFMPAADKALLDGASVNAVANTLVKRGADGTITTQDPTLPAHVASKGYVDDGRITATGGKKFRQIGCVIRFNSTSGAFEFINDAGHYPSGVSTIETYSDRIVINYSFTAAKVISGQATPDEKLAQDGFTMGPSVGLSSMTIYVGQGGAGDYVTTSGTTLTSLTGFVKSFTRSTTAWTFTHDTMNGPQVAQASYRGATYVGSVDGLAATTTSVALYNASGVLVDPSTASGLFKFWIMRGGTRKVNPLTDMNIANSNIWISGLFEV